MFRHMAVTEPFDPDQLTKSERANIRRRQGCTADDYARVFTEQDGKCACCGASPKPPSTHLRADTFRRDGKIVLVCQECFHILKILSTRSSRLLAYLESVSRTLNRLASLRNRFAHALVAEIFLQSRQRLFRIVADCDFCGRLSLDVSILRWFDVQRDRCCQCGVQRAIRGNLERIVRNGV